MNTKWVSKKNYEHPANHRKNTYGYVVLTHAGVYALRVGGYLITCPQNWAAKIHKEEK